MRASMLVLTLVIVASVVCSWARNYEGKNNQPEFYLEYDEYFGWVQCGEIETRIFTIYNLGSGVITLEYSDFSLYPYPEGYFSLNAENLPVSIGLGNSYSFSVSCHPIAMQFRYEYCCAYLNIDDNLPCRETHSYIIWADAYYDTPGHVCEVYPLSVVQNNVNLWLVLGIPIGMGDLNMRDDEFLGVNLYRDGQLLAFLEYNYEYNWYYTDLDVAYGPHIYTAQSVYDFGLGPMSYECTVMVDYISSVTGIFIATTGTMMHLEWDVIPNIEWYRIYTSSNLLSPWTCIACVGCPCYETPITADPSLFFRITAGVGLTE